MAMLAHNEQGGMLRHELQQQAKVARHMMGLFACSKVAIAQASWEALRMERAAILHLLTVWGVKMWGGKMIMRQREQHVRNQKRIGLVCMAHFHDKFRGEQVIRCFSIWQTLGRFARHTRKRATVVQAWQAACATNP